jgi:hypothetical protein
MTPDGQCFDPNSYVQVQDKSVCFTVHRHVYTGITALTLPNSSAVSSIILIIQNGVDLEQSIYLEAAIIAIIIAQRTQELRRRLQTHKRLRRRYHPHLLFQR